MATTLSINVQSPCTGDQLVTKHDTLFYAGPSGDFTYATINRGPSESRWRLVVFDYNRSTACTPIQEFLQDTPNANDPTGVYYGIDTGGDPDPDPDKGEAVVNAWP